MWAVRNAATWSGSSSTRWIWVGTSEVNHVPSRGQTGSSTGGCPATSERQITCSPATYVGGSASTQGPLPPSRRSVAATEARTARRDSTTRLGRPVDPEVSTTHGAGSAGASSQRRSAPTVTSPISMCSTLARRDCIVAVPSVLGTLKPPSPLAGKLAVQSVMYAVGDGTFMTASAVFFTQIVGLSAAQVGLGITLAGVVSFLVAVPAGKLADRIGPQRTWCLGAIGTAGMYLVWPFIDGFGAFVAMSIVLEVVNSAGGAGRGAYILDVLPRQERVQSQAYMYSALNLGFTAGAALGGIALAFDNDTIVRGLPFLTAALVGVNAFWISRLPRADHRARPNALEQAVEGVVTHGVKVGAKVDVKQGAQVEVPGALRNRGFLATSFFGGVMQTNQVLLQIVIPLWLVEETDAPRVLLALLFGTNTVMCIFLPMAAARGVRDVSTALRAVRLSSAFFVASCLITLITHDTVGWITIALVWLGHITVTGAELYFSAASWSFESELSDPDRRGEYQGAANLGGTLGYVWAPALYTFLAISWGPYGWLVIAAIVVAATIGIHPASRSAQRFLVRYDLDPSR